MWKFGLDAPSSECDGAFSLWTSAVASFAYKVSGMSEIYKVRIALKSNNQSGITFAAQRICGERGSEIEQDKDRESERAP